MTIHYEFDNIGQTDLSSIQTAIILTVHAMGRRLVIQTRMKLTIGDNSIISYTYYW